MRAFLLENLRPALQGKKVLLGISGSIAAYKSCEVVRGLIQCGAEVRVVLTDGGSRFVTRETLETLSGQRVLTSLWDEGGTGTHHIATARWADLILVAPASANTLAKLALGLADDLLSTEALAFRGPILLAPAMNPLMFSHGAVQANLSRLRERECVILGPALGNTACGEEGLGRMLEPEELVQAVARAFYRGSNGKCVLITVGPTRSFMDPVRYLTNRSSGKMGASLCFAAAERGYSVQVVTGPVEVPFPTGARVFRVSSAQEMMDQVMSLQGTSDIVISAAAVLDWEVKESSKQKLKKTGGNFTLDLQASPDILAALGARRRPGQYVLGFAAETENWVENAREKCLAKRCDAVFVNDVSLTTAGFESSNNQGYWVTSGASAQVVEIPNQSKATLARKLFDLIEDTYPQRKRPLSLGPGGVPKPGIEREERLFGGAAPGSDPANAQEGVAKENRLPSEPVW